MMGVLNFAHTSFYMIVLPGLPVVELDPASGGLLLAPLLVGLLGAAVEQWGLAGVVGTVRGHVAEAAFPSAVVHRLRTVQVFWAARRCPTRCR